MNPIFRIATAAMGLVMAAMATSQTASYDQHVAQAQADLKAGNPAQALTMSQKAIAAAPSRWEAYVVAGGALQAQQQYDEAADDFSKALERAPDAKKTTLRALLESCILAESAAPPSAAPPATAPAPAAQSPVQTQAASPPQAPLAAAPPSSAPPASEILAWISQNLGTVDTLPSPWTKSETQQSEITMNMVSQGCMVFFLTITKTGYSRTSSGKETDSVTTDSGQLVDLRVGVPDRIAVSSDPKSGDVELTIPFSQKMPSLDHAPSSYADSSSSYGSDDKLVIPFATQDMANRQAKAWRDAIVACKAQAVPTAPENLY